MKLRPYQQKLIHDIRKSIAAGHNAVLAQLGCGGGKSIIQAEIARSATAKGNRVLFLVHRTELCQQICGTFAAHGVDMLLCNVGMVQTVSRHIEDIAEPAVIITDEAHHSTARTYRKIYDAFPNAIKLGFSATPIRLNKGGLGEVYSDLITSVSTKWLIENHYLAPYKYFSFPLADVSGLHIRAGEYKTEEVNALMERKAVYAGAVEQYRKLATDRKTMVYCSSVKASIETAEEFQKSGINAVSLDGSMDAAYRRDVVSRFRSGEIRVLTNCNLFSEGYDDKEVECVILLRPTQSLTVYTQQAMRCMRYKEDKTALIIDCVGNVYTHDLPDADREWTLLPKRKQEETVKIRECQFCYAVYPPALDRCPYCGQRAEREVRTADKKSVTVDLVEIQRQEAVKSTKLCDTSFTTWDEVREYQQLRKLKFAFCLHYCREHGIEIPKKYRHCMRYIR